jgi:predicted  nucleic acid-binding Zn-ribbon protein
MATKNDLVYLETRLVNKLEAEITAVRGDIEQVNLRLDSIERTLSARLSQIEAEVSRLRSVVYLLVKDKPEMLRLLGQPPS